MSSRAYRRLFKVEEIPCVNTDFETIVEPQEGRFSKFESVCVQPPEYPPLDSPLEDESVPERKSRKKRKPREKRNRASSSQVDSDVFAVSKREQLTVSSNGTTSINPDASLAPLLMVDTRTFDPMNELNRMFRLGSRVPEGSHKQQSHLQRGPLVRIKPSWPPIVRFGLDMDSSPSGEFTFTHTREYRNNQKDFYNALRSAVPDNIMQILSKCPYHIDSLLQLSDIFMRQDNTEIALDLLERILHAYQSAFHPSFNPTLGTCRLNFAHQENRGLFVALFRYLTAIGARGCYHSALDYCKILLSLSVEDDPLACLLMIDYYALLAKQLNFLSNLYERLNPSRNLYLLPNFAFSMALATKWMENSSRADRDPDLLLQDALISFPGFLTRLMKHCTVGGVANLDKSTLFGKEVANEPESLGRLLDLYVARTHQLWTAPQVLSWLEHNVEAVLNLVESSSCQDVDPRFVEYSKRRKTLYPSLPVNILRHLVLADIPEAPPLLPNGFTHTHIYSFDPFPPADSINICSPDEEKGRVRNSQRNQSLLSAFFTSLSPTYSVNGAVEGDSATSSTSATDLWNSATERIASMLRHVLGRYDVADEPDASAQNAHNG